jgi:hypothetical protein
MADVPPCPCTHRVLMPNYQQQEQAAERISHLTTEFSGRTGKVKRTTDRNLWWLADGDTELIMFSLRADNVWRPFPGPADGPHLRTVKVQSKIKQPQRRK